MAEQTHITTLQRTLNEYRHEKRRIQSRLAELEHEIAHYREQLATFNAMIQQTGDALKHALELPSEPIESPYDSRYDPRHELRYEPRRESHYSVPYDSRAESPYDSQHRLRYDSPPEPRYEPAPRHPLEPLDYRQPGSAVMRAADIDEVIESVQRNEQQSNIRFADFRIPQAATIVLREAGQAMHVSEIYRRLAEGGFEFRGQHQLITLAVSLSRSKRFRKVAPGTFELDPAYQSGQVA